MTPFQLDQFLDASVVWARLHPWPVIGVLGVFVGILLLLPWRQREQERQETRARLETFCAQMDREIRAEQEARVFRLIKGQRGIDSHPDHPFDPRWPPSQQPRRA